MLLGLLWQPDHAWITYKSICRVLLAMTGHVTHVTISHVQPGHVQQMDTHD